MKGLILFMKKALINLTGILSMAAILAGCGNTTVTKIAPEGDKKSWGGAYDALITKATAESDLTKRSSLLHEAETMLMNSGAVCPIYYYTDQFLLNSHVDGFFDSGLGYKFFYDCTRDDGKTTMAACIASEPDTIDPALNSSVDGATYVSNSFTGLYQFKSVKGITTAVPALSDGEPVKTVLDDGKVKYVFTLKDSKWSDGTALTAADFVYAWNRAASGTLAADYAYIFDVIDGGLECNNDTTGTKKLNVTASEDGKTLTVVLTAECPYFNQLMAFPAYAPVKQSAVESSAERGGWATKPATYISNGPFKLDSWTSNSEIKYVKNPNYYDADNVSMTNLNFLLDDNDTTIYANYQNGAIDLADSFPIDSIATIKSTYEPKGEYFNENLLGTYYVAFNVNSTTFAKADTEAKRASVRRGLSLLIDRNYLIENVAKGDQTPANSFVAKGTYEGDGVTEFAAKNGTKGDGKGYYSVDPADQAANVAEGIALIKAGGYTYDDTKKKFTDFPTFTYILNKSSGHQAIAEYLQGAFSNYGITMKLDVQEWATFLKTRKAGDFDVARDGWNGDFNDAMTFLDMWTTSSGNNDCQLGKDAHAEVKVYENSL